MPSITADTTYTTIPGQEYLFTAVNQGTGWGSLTIDHIDQEGNQSPITDASLTADGDLTFVAPGSQVVVNLTTIDDVDIQLRPVGKAPGS